MAYKYVLPNATDGMDSVMVSMQTSIPSFIPMLLTFVFLVVFLGGALNQRRRVGYSDMPMWSVLASISTLLIALPMTLISGLISPSIFGVITILVLASGLWFFITKDRGEI